MSTANYLIEVCQRRGVTLKAVEQDLGIEFDLMRPPHDLIDQLRQHQVEVVRRLGVSHQESLAVRIRCGRHYR